MSFWELVRRIYYTSLFKNFIYFFCYWVLILCVHHILVSTAAFFHFQLGHRLGTIEEWIFEKGWEIVFLSKIICSWLILKFISIKSDSRNPMRDIFTKGFLWPEREVFVFAIFFILIAIVTGVPKKSDLISFSILKPTVAYFGMTVFFLADVLVLNALKVIHPFNKYEKWLSYLLFSGVLYIFSKIIFLYGLDISFNLYLIAFISFYFSDWKRSNWTIPAFFLLACIAPLSSLVGWDPIWKESYTPMTFSKPFTAINLSTIVAVAMGYFYYKSRYNKAL